MTRELTFLDLVVIEKMEKNSVMDSFGGIINSSFFDTAALMGTLQVKGLIEIKATVGRSIANRTKLGDDIVLKAIEKSDEQLDELDHAILKTIASGARTFEELVLDLNIRSDDLAFHLYKLVKQGYADYTIRNAKMTLTLTEPGFKLTGFVPRRREEIDAKVKEARAERARPPPEGDLEEAVATKEDILSGIQSAENPVALTRGRRFRAKYGHYLKTYAHVIVVFLVIALLLVARILGWI